MARKLRIDLGPALMVGVGILVSTFVAALATAWWVLAAPVLLALAVVGADVVRSRLRGMTSGPSPTALLLTGAILLAGLSVTLRDPALVKTLLPLVGAAAWAVLLPHSRNRRTPCANPTSNDSE